MKLELYSFPDCHEVEKIKEFLNIYNLPFKEIIVDNEVKRIDARKAKQAPITNTSFLKITHSHSIHIITGYNEFALHQLLEHIKKYNPKI